MSSISRLTIALALLFASPAFASFNGPLCDADDPGCRFMFALLVLGMSLFHPLGVLVHLVGMLAWNTVSRIITSDGGGFSIHMAAVGAHFAGLAGATAGALFVISSERTVWAVQALVGYVVVGLVTVSLAARARREKDEREALAASRPRDIVSLRDR